MVRTAVSGTQEPHKYPYTHIFRKSYQAFVSIILVGSELIASAMVNTLSAGTERTTFPSLSNSFTVQGSVDTSTSSLAAPSINEWLLILSTASVKPKRLTTSFCVGFLLVVSVCWTGGTGLTLTFPVFGTLHGPGLSTLQPILLLPWFSTIFSNR